MFKVEQGKPRNPNHSYSYYSRQGKAYEAPSVWDLIRKEQFQQKVFRAQMAVYEGFCDEFVAEDDDIQVTSLDRILGIIRIEFNATDNQIEQYISHLRVEDFCATIAK